ncbi:MAG: tetratricopeptide repeat protein [Myxococcales bacterium]|nr:tetratricopeptide repeat protein [Polyangiaceae bacterium]MDW8249477.1 tetratricopeptide repeat protein [Myxococcales bacterium]
MSAPHRSAPRALVLPLLSLLLAPHCTPRASKIDTPPAPSVSAAVSAGGSSSLDHDEEGEPGEFALDDGFPSREDQKERPAKPPPRVGLQGGLDALGASEYATAEEELSKASKNPKEKGPALVGLARVMLETGRLDEAIRLSDEAARVDKSSKVAAAPVKALALARRGKLEEALRACEAVKDEENARRARLVAGEILLRMGRSRDAEPYLMSLVNDFNSKKITPRDAEGMALVGRATHLLRSKRDANESYDDAERAGNKTPELFLWRARLFLEAYNIGRAEEMVRAALKAAPELAEARLLMAEVKLAQTLDFEGAEREIQHALAVDKMRPEAGFLRAGIALRDLEIEEAEKALAAGFAIDPRHPELLAMKAAIRFLADDKPGMEAALKATFEQNPEFARAYQIIGEFAEWEHRYAEIVEMMKKASKIDPQEGSFLVNLGLNQIRIGAEAEGIANLNLGFRKDKFNVRAYNTLNLYERDIPQYYESEKVGTRFLVRYPKDEKKVLERYLPRFLNDAWTDMQKRYGFEPTTPIGVELYGSREHFSVRTSGLPNVGIQGVCFGETLAAISPKAEPFNWGMVVWHEVGHVFAIQQSRNHVPRWFTEGLSEYETILRRPEWSREEDQALYLALRRGKVPAIEQMNRAFTHAEDARDMTTAYYASSQIVVFLAEKYGMPKLVTMLQAWGEGKRTPEVLRSALGVSGDEIDRQFRTWLDQRLARYKKQYLPDLRAKPLEVAEKEAQAQSSSAAAQIQLALARLAAGDSKGALVALDAAQKIEPKNPDARYLRARVALQHKKPDEARKELETMIAEGNDGYAVRMLLGDIASRRRDLGTAAAHFEAASNLDPTQAEPLQALADMARKAKDGERELALLRKLATLDQHDRRVWRRLLSHLVNRGLWDEANKVGEGALYVDIHGAETHALYAQALLETGDIERAIFEAESALLCQPLKERTAAKANVTLARAFLRKGDKVKARAARDEALRQDPENKDAKALQIP